MNKWFLVIILGLAFILRVVSLDRLPVGFTPDEASFGYDAYSILKTGKDQWGTTMPLVLKSFGDYKAPLYSYILIPFISVFDLNKFSVRLPNALMGVGAVYVLYLLSSVLFKKLEINERKMSLLAALMLALSPWHIMMSRGGFEANMITFFLTLAVYLFFIKKYSLSALFFGLNLFTYHSAKLITPLIVLFLVAITYKEIKELGFKKIINPFLILSFFGLLTLYTFTLGAGERVKDVNIFSGSIEEGSEIKNMAVISSEPYFVSKLIHNKYTVSFDRFLNNYVSYFSPQFLLTKGPAETTYGMMPGTGVLNVVEFIGLISFILFFVKYKQNKIILFLILWLLVSIIPASLATGPGFAANRAVAMLPVLQLISAIGLYNLVISFKNLKYPLAFLAVLSFLVFIERYIFISPIKSAQGMLFGNLETAQYLIEKDNNEDYKEIIISKTLSEPHIYIAFASKMDPNEFQEDSKKWNFEEQNLKWVDQLPIYSLNKFIFKKYNWRDEISTNSLIAGKVDEFPELTNPLHSVKYLDGIPAIYIIETSNE